MDNPHHNLAGTLACLLPKEVVDELASPDCRDLCVNQDGSVWVDRQRADRRRLDVRITSDQAHYFLRQLASSSGLSLATEPRLQVDLPPGPPFFSARLHAVLGPLNTAPVIAIRRHQALDKDLDAWVSDGSLTQTARDFLATTLRDRRNLLVAGSTASGKTTFANALLSDLSATCPTERIVLIEDTPELQLRFADSVRLLTSPARDSFPPVTWTDLVTDALRLAPSRIVLGEIRDHAALSFIDAMQTGHGGGLATIHASSAADALTRLDRLAIRAPAVSVPHVRYEISEVIDYIVVLQRGKPAPSVVGVYGVRGWSPDHGFTLAKEALP